MQKTVFGMTLEEVSKISREIDEDAKYPHVPREKPVDFVEALRKGSELLRADESFRQMFRCDL